jgi:hypothetical protein
VSKVINQLTKRYLIECTLTNEKPEVVDRNWTKSFLTLIPLLVSKAANMVMTIVGLEPMISGLSGMQTP